MTNPGLLLYFGIFAFLILPFLYKDFRTSKFMYIYFAHLITLIAFWLTARTTYWYIMPSFTFFALGIPVIVSRVKNWKIKKALNIIVAATCLSSALLMVKGVLTWYEFKGDLVNSPEQVKMGKDAYTLSKYLEEKTKDGGKIFNASELPAMLVTTYFTNEDSRVIRKEFYFASSGKNVDDIYREFKKNDIRYILTAKEIMFTDWYQGCTRRNSEMIAEFLNKYAVPDEKYPNYISYIK
jgi:hypothetical protein